MNSTFLKIMLLSIVVLASPRVVKNQTSTVRNGNWWIEQGNLYKLEYATGFFDGVELGNNFSYWGIIQKQKDDPAIGKVAASFDSYTQKYLTSVTTGQLVDGLDKFYSDYRNRRIRINGAVWLVLNGIAGTPDSELEKMIENWRKNAVQPPQ